MKNRTIHHQKLLFCSSILSSAIAATAVQADDIDVYLLPPQDPVSPNVLFVLDESGSMEWGDKNWVDLADTNPNQRMYILKQAMTNVLNDTENDYINAAIFSYTSRTHPTQVIHKFALVKDKRADMISEVNGLDPSGWTPSVHALSSAIRVYIDGFNDGTTAISSPIAPQDQAEGNWCAPNMVIFMSDGDPNSNRYEIDLGGDLELHTNPDQYKDSGGTLRGCDDSTTEIPYKNAFNGIIYRDSDTNFDGACTGEIVTRGKEIDLRSGGLWDQDKPDTPRDESMQNILTYAVGMKMPSESHNRTQYMNYIAHKGGGQYFNANNADELTEAFQTVLNDAKTSITYSYNAPAIPFQADNAAISGNAMYLPLFEPSVTDFWKGNIKKYSIAYNNGFTIRGRSNVATETSTLDDGGFSGNGCIDRDAILLADSTDYWNNSGSSDGGNPLLGGAASNMAVSSGSQRELYTDIGLGNGSDLIADANRIHPDNHESDDGSNILTNTILDASNDTEALDLLNWIAWTDADDSHEGEMGAPLHTQPQVVGDYVLVSTVEGILHAFNKDSDEGDEAWAYMPSELLSTIKRAKANVSLIDENSNSFSSPMYGLDGPMTIYETESDGKTYVVVGQRRGGRAYYALDITNPASPKFAWKIIGGTTSGFNKLGQTWSKPIFTKVEISGGTEKEVLIFGGGYDPAQDSKTSRTDDAMGNAIFIVDAADGSIIYTIANTGANLNIAEMKNAIASDILPVDINTNGYTDRIYAAGVGGRIIRVDIPDSGMGGASPTGGVIADINDGQSDYRRFFNTPEVGYYKRGGQQFLSLMLTSGNRTQPVGNSGADTNGLFTIKDFDVWGPPSSSYNTVTTTDLFDASVNLDGDTSNDVDNVYGVDMDTTTSGVQAPKGWYVTFDSGEKGFSTVKIYDYAVLFTTFNGLKNISTDSCIPSVTCSTSYLYALNMLNGKARFADLTGIDGRTELKSPGMPPAPQLLFPQTTVDNPGGDPLIRLGGTVDAIVGLEKLFSWEDKFHPVSWEEVTD